MVFAIIVIFIFKGWFDILERSEKKRINKILDVGPNSWKYFIE